MASESIFTVLNITAYSRCNVELRGRNVATCVTPLLITEPDLAILPKSFTAKVNEACYVQPTLFSSLMSFPQWRRSSASVLPAAHSTCNWEGVHLPSVNFTNVSGSTSACSTSPPDGWEHIWRWVQRTQYAVRI